MKKPTHRARMTLVAHALALAFGGALLSGGLVAPAYAQSNATGIIFGQIANAKGASVVLENTATGARRTVYPDASGRYQATSMQPGTYKVMLMRGDDIERTLEVEALIGQGV